jgi:hypothetical protein
MKDDAYNVTSEWTIEPVADLVFGATAEDGARILKVLVDGQERPYQSVPGHERYVRLATPLSGGKAVTITITSTLPVKASREDLRVLTADELPRPEHRIESLSQHSYADPVETTMTVHAPAEWLVAASSLAGGPLVAGRYAVVIGHKDFWKQQTCSVEGLDCVLVTRIKDPLLTKDLMHALLAEVVPRYGRRFGPATDHIVMVDCDWDAISGGLLGTNVLGFFAKPKLSPEEQAGFKAAFGWAPQPSTKAYVAQLYKSAKDPWREYMTGMLSHEFAHLYFGFGRTAERIQSVDELWLSLGLGLVYDEIVTTEITGHRDAFFAAVEANWRDKFATNPSVDQRLIRPDTSHDAEFHLSRAHVYAHGKALAVLRTLRERAGKEAFDRAVAEYLRTGVGGYDAFRPRLAKLLPKLADYERELGV